MFTDWDEAKKVGDILKIEIKSNLKHADQLHFQSLKAFADFPITDKRKKYVATNKFGKKQLELTVSNKQELMSNMASEGCLQ